MHTHTCTIFQHWMYYTRPREMSVPLAGKVQTGKMRVFTETKIPSISVYCSIRRGAHFLHSEGFPIDPTNEDHVTAVLALL